MSRDDTTTRRGEPLPSKIDVTAVRAPLVIPSIELGRQIGVGGMAVVYEGLDQGFTPARRVAVKLMDPRLSADTGFRARFEREASLVAEFRHENIVHVYSSGEVDGAKYLVMEYLAGGTLAERIESGPLPVAEAISIGALLAEALSYSHARGVVHRDFKPSNVLITADGKPVLSDFGIAKPTLTAEAALTKQPVIMGSARYMAPEQSLGRPVTDRADLYSFGMTMFEMLTGREPELPDGVLRDPKDGSAIRALLEPISPILGDLICRCLLFDPEARPSAQECARVLRSLWMGAAAPAAARPHLRIFVSSPSDVIAAREVAFQIIEKLAQEHARFFTLEPYLWDYERMLASGQLEDVVDPPSRFEAVILILASRLGTLLPERTARREYRGIGGRAPLPGTEWAFEDALIATRERGVPELLVYRSQGNVEVSTRDAENRQLQLTQLEALDAFWARYAQDTTAAGGRYAEFNSLEEFTDRFETDLRGCVERWVKDLSPVERAATVRLWAKAPFRGLESYEFEHAQIFFGRDEVIGAALLRLSANARAGRPFLLVLGASGSGKSSFVKAGLVPRLLAPQRVPGVAFLRRVVFRPSDVLAGEDLFDALARRLTEHGPEGTGLPELLGSSIPVEEFARHLREASQHPQLPLAMVLDQLAELARSEGRMLRYEQGVLLLTVDQLEELFTGERVPPEERARFVQLLAGLVRSGRVWIIATMRADFWHRAAETPDLVRLADSDGRLDLLPPTPSELSRMIRGPAEAAAIHFETHAVNGIALSDVIAEAAAGEPGALPLLSYLLDQLYQNDIKEAGGDSLTYASYDALGGLKGAIARRADAVLAAQPPEVRQALRSVLFALVQTSAGEDSIERAVSRRAPLTDFPPGSPKLRLIQALLEPSTRLLVAEGGEGKTANVCLAHEALINEWETAREYVVGNAEALRSRRILEERYARWQAIGSQNVGASNGRRSGVRSLISAFRNDPEHGLLSDLDLSDARRLLRDYREELSPDLVHYIERSIDQDRRRRRRTVRMVTAVAVAMSVLAVGATVFAYVARQQKAAATETRLRAEREARTAQETTEFMVSLFHVVDPSEARGNSITAREILDGAATRIREQLGGQPAVEARLLRTIGDVYDDLGLYGKSKSLLEDALRIGKSLPQRDDADIARTEAALAETLTEQEDYSAAEPLLIDAIHHFDTRRELDGESARAHGTLALLYWKRGGYAAARRAGEEALHRATVVFGRRSEEAAGILHDLALTVRDMGDPASALLLLKESAEIRKGLFGENYPWYGMDLEGIGLTLLWLERSAEARPYYEQAIGIYERTLGPEHPFVAEALQGLGNAEAQLGQYNDAEESLTRALKIEETSLGPNSIEVARTLGQLAKAYAQGGEFARGEPLFQRSIAIEKAHLPDSAQGYIGAMNQFAWEQTRAGRLEGAATTLRIAVASANKLSPSSAYTMAAFATLADVLCYQGPNSEGYAAGQRALALISAAANPMQIAVVRSDAAECDSEPSHYAQNTAVLENALATIEKTRGPSAPQTKDAQRRLVTFTRNHAPLERVPGAQQSK